MMKEKENLGKNLRILMEKADLSPLTLARLTGVPDTTIKKLKNLSHQNPTLETLTKLASFFSISLDQLVHHDLSENKITIPNYLSIPILSWENCYQFESIDYDSIKEKVFTDRKISNKTFSLIINNKDLDFFEENGILIIEPSMEPSSGDFVIATKKINNVTSIKKYIVDDNQKYLKPLIYGLNAHLLDPGYQILGVALQYKYNLK